MLRKRARRLIAIYFQVLKVKVETHASETVYYVELLFK